MKLKSLSPYLMHSGNYCVTFVFDMQGQPIEFIAGADLVLNYQLFTARVLEATGQVFLHPPSESRSTDKADAVWRSFVQSELWKSVKEIMRPPS